MTLQMGVARKLVGMFFIACAFYTVYVLGINVSQSFGIAVDVSTAMHNNGARHR